jgi:hypothetical protein
MGNLVTNGKELNSILDKNTRAAKQTGRERRYTKLTKIEREKSLY